jgi:hypothetical protein
VERDKPNKSESVGQTLQLPWKQKRGKVFPTDCDFFLAYLIRPDVYVTGNITAKLCEVGSEFNIFSTLVTMATAAILWKQKRGDLK